MANSSNIGDRGKSLEDEFFRKENDKAVQRLRELQQQTDAREAFSKVAGISNPAIIDRLIALGIRPEIVSALAIVPLVQVAWADGSLDDKERKAVMDRAEKSGITPGSVHYDLLRSWLDTKPEPRLFTAWTEMVRGIAEQMGPEELATLKTGLIERAQAVARASGGFLGVGSVSAAEQATIDRLGAAFEKS